MFDEGFRALVDTSRIVEYPYLFQRFHRVFKRVLRGVDPVHVGMVFGPKHTLEQLYSDRHLFARRPRARIPETCYVSRCFCCTFLVSGTARAHLWESVICCMFLLVSGRVDWSCQKPWICVIFFTISSGFQLLFDMGAVCAGTIIPDAYLTRDFTYFPCTAEPLAQPF